MKVFHPNLEKVQTHIFNHNAVYFSAAPRKINSEDEMNSNVVYKEAKWRTGFTASVMDEMRLHLGWGRGGLDSGPNSKQFR